MINTIKITNFFLENAFNKIKGVNYFTFRSELSFRAVPNLCKLFKMLLITMNIKQLKKKY